MTIEVIRITSREEWLAWRRQDLTASDVAAAAGFSRHSTPMRVYAEKTGMVGPQPDNGPMQRGRWLEAAVVAALRERRPEWVIKRAGVYLRDPDIRLGATPDAVAEVPGIDGIVNVQLKVVARSVFNRDWTEEEAPLEYQVQTLVEGRLVDAAHNVIVALVISEFDAELEIRDCPRHAAAEERAVEVAREFWARVDRGDPPPMNYAQDADLVTRLHPQSIPGMVIDLGGDNRIGLLLEQLTALRLQRSDLKEDIEVVETEIKAKLGDAEGAVAGDWRVSFKSNPRKAYSVPAGTVRQLRFYRSGEEERE